MAARNLELRRFRRAAATSSLAEGVAVVVLPLVTLGLTERALDQALVVVALSLPWALWPLVEGVLPHRLDRRTTLGVASTVRSAAFGLLAVQLARGEATVALVLLCAFAAGIADAAADDADAVAMATVVPIDSPTSDGWTTRLGVIGVAVGILAGGILWGVFDALGAIAVTLLSSVGALAALALPAPLLPTGKPTTLPAPDAAAAGPTRALTASLALLGASSAAGVCVLASIADQRLGVGAFGLSSLLVALVVAGAAGAALAPTFGTTLGLRAGAVTGALLAAAGLVVAGATLDPDQPLVAVGALLLAAAGSAVALVLTRALRRSMVADHDPSATVPWRTAMATATPAGAALGGLLAEGGELNLSLHAAGVLALLAAAAVLGARLSRRPETDAVVEPLRVPAQIG